jgi:FAD/FMN-containing dehydrogenase
MQLSTDVRSRLRTDGATLGAYVSDASIFRRVPKAVFEPRSVEDIRAVLQVARTGRSPSAAAAPRWPAMPLAKAW